MRTLAARPEDERLGVARETMDIYGPLANRLGIGQLKWELEDLAFRFIEPELYKEIAGLIDERRKNREKFILRVINHLQNALQDEGIHAQIDGRPKHIYSIWRKMKRKHKDYHEIYDVRAVRVLVDEIRDCYAVLGVVHSLWMPIPGEFDDYIATPKENGYRSLHTAVIGPKGKTLEVQIRTNQMHQESEYGIAAHWRYKEGTRFDAGFESKIAWLRQILEWKDELANITDFVDHLKSEVLEDRVYVFTPKGNVFDFPQGASPVDFAYRIHTEIGHRCRGAKVDGVIVPLNTELKTGERVEILTAKEGGPSRDWLNSDLGYIKTSKARTKVQHWFRQLNIEQNIAGGRQLLEKELHRLGLSKLRYEDLAKQQGYQKVEDFLAALGRGELKVTQVNRTAQELVAELIEPARPPERSLPVLRRQSGPDAAPDVQVEGVGNLLTQIAKCCKPVPGEPIVGFITQGRGVTIHRRDCPNVVRFQEECFERLMEVNWDEETKGVVQADIHINAVDRPGLLHDITAVLANDKINLIAAQTLSSKHNNSAEMDLTLEIGDMQQLSRILSKINALPNVVDAWRRLA
jgi:GTP pyrophosphokinase